MDGSLRGVTTFGKRNRAEFPSVSPGQRISVDVFDTLLLRKPISERGRFFRAAAAFVRKCPVSSKPSVLSVYSARREAHVWAYHALDALGQDGEVRIADIFERQLLILGLPTELASLLLEAEIEVEVSVLEPNRPLIQWLLLQRSRQIPVIAISDTWLSRTTLQGIINSVAPGGAIDRLYTSAELGFSKRKGGIFADVAERENIPVSALIHFGDDANADVVQAAKAGIVAYHLPRSRFFVLRRKLDGALFETRRHILAFAARRKPMEFTSSHRDSEQSRLFGRNVLGPIFTRYCLRLWLYLSFANQSGNEAAALFCARGGLNMRVIFERFLERLQLPLATPRTDLMVSRLVAARAALLRQSPSAFDEIGREFSQSTLATVARAIAQSDIAFGPEWEQPFEPELFMWLVRSTEAGEKLMSRVAEQNALFTSHLEGLVSDKKRLILCDTGLFGSTLRMLKDGFPERRWECLLFARCNYKGFASEHFSKTLGLVSEHNFYNPLHASSIVLRYWHLFEHLFESDLQSVRTFARSGDDEVVSNLEQVGWREHMEATRSPLLEGVLDYLGDLPREGWFERLNTDESGCWRALKKAVRFPNFMDIHTLATGERSHDFGRDGRFTAIPQKDKISLKQKLIHLRTARWKEGYATQQFPFTRFLIHGAVESGYVLRWLRSWGANRP